MTAGRPDGASSDGAGRGALARQVRGFVRSYGDGRTCAEEDCTTTLSRYNKDDLCWRHAEQADRRPDRF